MPPVATFIPAALKSPTVCTTNYAAVSLGGALEDLNDGFAC